jgi:threonine dehydrogenase-like Zn-dependent dehydrogenase
MGGAAMKAVVVESRGVLSVCDDVPAPVIGPYDALVRIKTCGFCNGTDTRIIYGEMSEKQGLQPYPTVLGHEAAGVVIQIGEKVRNISVGEKHIGIRGGGFEGSRYSSTHGQMAEYGIICDWAAKSADGGEMPPRGRDKPARLPDDFDLTDAGVLLPLCECLSAVRHFGIGPETDVLVYGAGPMGLAMMQYMKIENAKSVTCIDNVPERLEMAKRVAKVDRTVNFSEEDADAALGDALFDRAVDAVGLSSVISGASWRLKPFGAVCALGVLRKDDNLVNLSALKNNTSVHMLNFPYREYDVLDENIGYIQKGLINPKDYYSHVLPMEKAGEALRIVNEKRAVKVILTI